MIYPTAVDELCEAVHGTFSKISTEVIGNARDTDAQVAMCGHWHDI